MEKNKVFEDINNTPLPDGVDELYTIVSTIGSYTIINRHTSYLPWVAAWCYHEEEKCWANGNYFSTLENAVLYAMSREKESELISAVMDICDKRADRSDIAEQLMEMMVDENMIEED